MLRIKGRHELSCIHNTSWVSFKKGGAKIQGGRGDAPSPPPLQNETNIGSLQSLRVSTTPHIVTLTSNLAADT